MDDASAELRQLLEELEAADTEMIKELNSISAHWAISLGSFRITGQASTSFLSRIYTWFSIVCFAAGIALAFAGGAFTSIGVALIVGSMLSFGTFVTQFWAVQAQDELALQRKYLDEVRHPKLKEFAAKRLEISRRIEHLRRIHPSENTESQ
jgi:pheromone shutdown protein TraB